MNLSPTQKEIVKAPVGNILVVATAGSGKTRVLTERVRYLLERDPLDGVLALTFTNKAAEEMRERLADVEDISERTFIGTIHSFAQSIIEKHGRHIGYAEMPHIFERDEDRKRFLKQAVAAYSNSVHEQSVSYNSVSIDDAVNMSNWLGKISRLKRDLLTDDEIEESFPSDNTLQIYREYNALLRQHNGVDFDDLLVLAYRVLTDMPSIAGLYARSYPHVCIDEAQDLNNAQYQLISALCLEKTESLMLVGDPNQSIYGFNGSSPDFMMKLFVSDFSPTKFALLENYRSTKAVLKLANLLKPGSQKIDLAPLEGKVHRYAASDEGDEAEKICQKIQELLNIRTHPEIEGEITLEKMIALARNRYVFTTLQERLNARGWDWYLKKSPGAPIFESRIGKLVDLTLRVIINPKDMLHFNQLCALTEIKTKGTHTVQHCLEQLENVTDGRLRGIGKLLPTVITTLKQEDDSASPNMEIALDRIYSEVEELLDTDIQKEELDLAFNDIKDLKAHWHLYVKQTPSAASLTLSGFRNAMAMGKTHPDTTPRGLALSTVHTMKGLEKDIVFLMGMGQGTFPDYRAIGNKSKMREELNNANVAVTRARRFLFITYPKTKMMPWGERRRQEPSEFLKKMELI